MALNSSGAISLGGTTAGQSIALENGGPGTAQISLNDTAVRSLAGPTFTTPATTIIMPTDFYGKSNTFTFTVTAGTDVNLRTRAIAAGWPGSGAVQANINSGTTLQASTTGTYALTIDGAWPGGITVVNSGTVVGRGGAGGPGGAAPAVLGSANGAAGGSGGTAILVSVPVTINNASGIISGGGGAGGGGGGRLQRAGISGGGGGGGGNGFGSGGTGGPTSSAPVNGQPGQAGGALTGGNGGGSPNGGGSGAGGPGGSNAGTGTSGQAGGASGGGGGAGGNALSGNPLVTFPALGTIYGPRV